MISAISIKDRLKNQAAAKGKTLQEALTIYGMERAIYRLSVSEYVERFTLKGGIFLYALFDGDFALVWNLDKEERNYTYSMDAYTDNMLSNEMIIHKNPVF